ncbi:MAG: PD40 domain-containing protein [Myxococcales bacterium]|nr:PD40 domain-containing protein [Myxococcales bacterium]
MPLAVASPAAQDPKAAAQSGEFDQALLYDFTACGLFQVLDRKSFLADTKEGVTASSINFASWSNVGAEALVKAQLASDGESIRGDLRLFTVATGREDLKTSESAPADQVRRLAHRLANAVYKHLTRETGPFESHLAWVKKTSQGKDVYRSDWDGRGATLLASGGFNVLPALAPDGASAAFTSFRRGKPEIFLHRGGSSTPVVHAGRMATGVAFSPDGRRIAYSQADGESAQIWVAQVDGSNPRQVTNTPFFINSSPTWSPDGRRLAFVSNRGGSPQLYLQSADGSGEAKRLTFQGNYNQTPDWSPRADLIAFTARDERNAFDLFTVNVETGKVNRLTQDQGNNEEPSFSPNGRLIVFTSTRNGWPQLFVMMFDGNNQSPLPMERGSHTTPDWGP